MCIISGVVPADLLSIIRGMVKNGQFTVDSYNDALERLQFYSYESESKPCPVPISFSKKISKLSGKAISNWVHIRNFPLVVKDLIQDGEDPVLHLGLLLHEIVERLTAQEFLHYEIDILEDKIDNYMKERALVRERLPSIFHRPKPKHHYMRYVPKVSSFLSMTTRVFLILDFFV